MNDREKLIALLGQCSCVYSPPCNGECGECHNVEMYDSEIAKIADHLLANGVTIQRWIPVTERLPEDDVEVLTRRATGMSVESRCGFGWAYDEYNGRWEVTHWMHLPEPPIEEQNRAREGENDG